MRRNRILNLLLGFFFSSSSSCGAIFIFQRFLLRLAAGRHRHVEPHFNQVQFHNSSIRHQSISFERRRQREVLVSGALAYSLLDKSYYIRRRFRSMAPLMSASQLVQAALLLCALSVVSVTGRAAPRSVLGQQSHRSTQSTVAFLPRGGATLAADDEYDSEEYDEYDEESEDEREAAAALAAAAKAKAMKKAAKKAALSASTVKAAAKAKSKKSKDAVNVKLAASPSARSSRSRSPLLKIPYIVRACLNPFTVIAMTKAYWQSLFNIHYMEDDAAQPLRSALEEKAKKAGGSTGLGGRGGKRRYKPGQAKTLADLPQLSA